MAIEIERKFLVLGDAWRSAAVASERLRDGLLGEFDGKKLRVRIGAGRATLALKSDRLRGRRVEYEYDIPVADAEAMLATMCGDKRLEKTRHKIPFCGHVWTIDAYEGGLAGVVIAELELYDEAERFARPDWLGPEVTEDWRFSKRALLRLCLDPAHPLGVMELLAATASLAAVGAPASPQ
jgi:adenylate cyclase